MFKNFLITTFRNLKRYKGYTLINVLGLAVGIAVCVLISRYVLHELSYDEYHAKSDRIHRVVLDHPQLYVALTPSMISPSLQRLFPEVETGVRLYDVGSYQPLLVRNKDRVFEERRVVYADSTLFDVFDFELIGGDPNTALARSNTVVITRDIARKYFNDETALGKILEINGRDYEVTGVLEDIPQNTHFEFDFFISMTTQSSWSQLSDDTWKAANFYTYIVLDEQGSAAELNKKINSYIEENFAGQPFVESVRLELQPLTDIHLYSEADHDIAPQGDISYVLGASVIAALILLIACINYMNLATARSARRSREVGIRKVLGSQRNRLIAQFYGESAILTLISLALAVIFIELSLPWFNRLIGQSLEINYRAPAIWGMLAATGLTVTLMAGSYPALNLSSFKPVTVLKGSTVTGGNARLRKYLVVFQFATSIFLVISTLVVYQQISFVQQKELGYKQQNVLALTAYGEVEKRFGTLKSELDQLPEFLGTAMVSESPVNIGAGYGPDVEGVDEGPNFIANALRATPDFTGALQIGIVAGRGFTEGDFERANRAEDAEYAMLVNKAAAAEFGLTPEEIVGRSATISGGSGRIVGVIENFHFTSLHRPIEPLFVFPRDGFGKLLISFNTTDIQQTLADTRKIWEQLFPQYPFEYEFLDQEYQALYRQETRAGNIFTTFAVLAIFVACLGLVGLASYTVERRSREIGVRKVLGATVSQILALFYKNFLALITVGFIIALPVAWYVMDAWLQNFAYKINIGIPVILLAGLVTVAVSFLAVGYQAMRAASINPAETLKNE